MDQIFQLEITGTEHEEWQGILQNADGDEIAFRSVLELLRAIGREVDSQL